MLSVSEHPACLCCFALDLLLVYTLSEKYCFLVSFCCLVLLLYIFPLLLILHLFTYMTDHEGSSFVIITLLESITCHHSLVCCYSQKTTAQEVVIAAVEQFAITDTGG